MRDCQRCGGEVSWTYDTVKLIGGVRAHLCNPCITEFGRFYMSQQIHDEYVRIRARNNYYTACAYARIPVSEEDWLELEAWEADADKRMYDIALEWLQTIRRP